MLRPCASSDNVIHQYISVLSIALPRFLWDVFTRCLSCDAGQAVVQMARSKMTGLEYAIKFFVSVTAYKVECGMYRRGSGVQDSELAQFLPQVPNFHC